MWAITGVSVLTGILTERLLAATDPTAQATLSLPAALSALALLEHWLMVVPVPDAKLWRWMLPGAPGNLVDKAAPEEL